MKITFIIRSLRFGGAERVVTELSKAMCKENQISIITFNQYDEEYELNERINRINLNLSLNKIKLKSEVDKLKECCVKLESDCYVAFDTLANLYLIMALYNTKCKFGISERNAPKQSKYSIYTRILRKLLYKKADFFIFQTSQAAQFYSKKIQEKSYIIPNPVRDNLPIKDYKNDKKKIVAVGRLEFQKNYELLINAFTKFSMYNSEYILEIYGEGKDIQKLKELCSNNKIENKVFFMGNCRDVHYRIVDSEIYVLSSRFEGIPNALLEAMAMGFPVIATDCPVGGPAELICNNKNGILVSLDSCDELADAMNFLVSNRKEAIKYGESAKKVRDDYSLDKIIVKWQEAFNLEIHKG